MGEALDGLSADLVKSASSTLVLIHKLGPDQFFTAEQRARQLELMARRDSLTEPEMAELVDLVDAEIDATVLRTDAIVQQLSS